MPDIPAPAIGPIVAALVAGLVSLLGLIISKEQKTSEIREARINAFREDVADLVARVNTVADTYELQGTDQSKWEFETVRQHYVAANLAATRLRLRLNPDAANHKRILDCLHRYEEQFQIDRPDDPAMTAIENELLSATREMLSAEWNRIRRGEPLFLLTMVIAVIAIATAASGALILML